MTGNYTNVPSFGTIIHLQRDIRLAVCDDDEISARYLDDYLSKHPEHQNAAMALAHHLWHLRHKVNVTYVPDRPVVQLRLEGFVA